MDAWKIQSLAPNRLSLIYFWNRKVKLNEKKKRKKEEEEEKEQSKTKSSLWKKLSSFALKWRDPDSPLSYMFL